MASAPINLPSIYQSIQAPKGTNPQDAQLAKDQFAIQFAPQESGIHSTIQQIQSLMDQDISAQQQYGEIADQKIANVGSQLAQQLTGNVGAIGNIYQAGGQQVGNIYDSAMGQAQAAGQSIQDRLIQSAGNLGQQQSLKADPFGADPLSRLMASNAQTQNRLVQGKASTQGAMAQLGTQLQGIAQKAVGDSEREYGQKRADIATQVLQSISKLQLGGQKEVMEQLRKYSDLAEIAGPTFRTLLSQATSARTKAEQDAAEFALKTLTAQAQINKDNAAAEKSRREDDPNSLDNLLKMAELQNKGLTGQKLSRDLERPTFISDSEGETRLQQYLAGAVRRDKSGGAATVAARKESGLSGPAVAGIQNFIRQNAGAARMSGLYNTADPVAILTSLAYQQIDPKTGKVNLPKTEGSKYGQKDYQVDLQTLLDAINIRYTNVGTGARVGDLI